ncbi:unnamed protein product [Adineta steineri]|uniref:Copper type II ascorbate-dependent monooxygenase N-terminal domain-containing protein n=2 Tax=Adineta steineri TaxID=433720 RepID=A0A819NLD5_9BILA|nr:unnamed protein product [Adineta steineri]
MFTLQSGTNVVIFAYGLVDPDLSGSHDDISYHENRRGTKMIPLQFYGQPPPDEKFAELDYFDFHPNNYLIPSTDTTYHCKVYKLPSKYTTKRHVIAHKTLIDSGNEDLIHHLLLHECDHSATFDNDSDLPDGPCNDITDKITACTTKIAIGWTIGGDRIFEFSDVAGYPIGGDSSVKYYMIQMHYDNPKQSSNRRDSSGLRFYLSNELRQHDLGYLVFGTDISFLSLVIPPRVDQFVVDSYCPSTATRGGERTKEEMCLHTFAYYPRMDDLSACFTMNTAESFQNMMYSLSSAYDMEHAKEWLLDIKWTPELAAQWQEYYNNAPRLSLFVREGHFVSEPLGLLPKYRDLEPTLCKSKPIGNETIDLTGNAPATNLQKIFILLSCLLIIMKTSFCIFAL